jgi:hypothetical protein
LPTSWTLSILKAIALALLDWRWKMYNKIPYMRMASMLFFLENLVDLPKVKIRNVIQEGTGTSRVK